jgi:hypothetical protein
MAIAMSVVFIAMIALPKLTQQMQALSHRILPEPKNLGPFDIEPSLVSIPTNPWTFHLGKFAFQFPIDFQPYNSKANSIEFVRDTPELRATNGEMLTWYSIHSLPPKEVAPFTREWYNIEQKRLEDDGLKVLSMDEGTLMGSRCMRAVVEKDHIPARQGL